jgi:two-component system, OmpR family, KDP operon response regulator KdpE
VSASILVVDDEPQIRRVLRTVLRAHGHQVTQAECGAAALRQLEGGMPDLLLLDLGLPDMEGALVIQRLRETSAVPILGLATRGDCGAARRSLEAGGDDILGKPFATGELLQRIAAVLATRRAIEAPLAYDGFAVDLATRSLTRDGAAVAAQPEDVTLLAALAVRRGAVMTDEQLIRAAWGNGSRLDLRLAVHRLRAILERDPLRPTHLLTEAGIGYRLVEQGSKAGAGSPQGAGRLRA